MPQESKTPGTFFLAHSAKTILLTPTKTKTFQPTEHSRFWWGRGCTRYAAKSIKLSIKKVKKLSTGGAWLSFYVWNIMLTKWEKVGNLLIIFF